MPQLKPFSCLPSKWVRFVGPTGQFSTASRRPARRPARRPCSLPCGHSTNTGWTRMEMRCPDCGVTATPTNYDYVKLLKHQKGYHVQLVNKATGEVVASSPKGAHSKGINLPGIKRTALTCSKPVLDLRLNYDKFTLNLEISFDGGSST